MSHAHTTYLCSPNAGIDMMRQTSYSILLPLTKSTLMEHVLLEIQTASGSLASTRPHKHRALSCIDKQQHARKG